MKFTTPRYRRKIKLGIVNLMFILSFACTVLISSLFTPELQAWSLPGNIGSAINVVKTIKDQTGRKDELRLETRAEPEQQDQLELQPEQQPTQQQVTQKQIEQRESLAGGSGQAKFDSMDKTMSRYETMIDNNTFSDDDLRDLEALITEADQLNKQYKYKYMSAASNIGNRAENAIREYKENRTKLQAKSQANDLRKKAEPLISKINNDTATEAEIVKAKELMKEARALYKKYWEATLSDVAVEINDALTQREYRQIQAKQDAESKKDQEDLMAKEQAKVDDINQQLYAEAKELLQKYGTLGPPEDFLLARFETYGMRSSSGPIITPIRLHDFLQGDRTWAQDPISGAWILTQKVYIQSERKYAINEFMFTIVPKTIDSLKKGTPWLEAIVSDGQPFPRDQLSFWTRQNIPYSYKQQ